MSEKSETRYIVIAPSSSITPDQITRFIHTMAVDVQIKETCFGVIVQGERQVVANVLTEVRKLDPNRLFSKVRGYPIGDGRRCRAEHGSRPGFTQLEKEWKAQKVAQNGPKAANQPEMQAARSGAGAPKYVITLKTAPLAGT